MNLPAINDYDGVSYDDDIVLLHGVTWEDYLRILEIRGDKSAPRITYLEGELEIMSPSMTREAVKSMIGCLVEVWCLHHGIEFKTLGSWTIKKRPKKRKRNDWFHDESGFRSGFLFRRGKKRRGNVTPSS